MSSQRKHKTSFKKKTTTEYWGDDAEPQYTEEQKRRIASYLKENDENCKESTTLILIIVIGLLVALSIVGFLAIRNNSSVKYKGAHTTYEHGTTNSSIMNLMWSKWNWLQGLYFGLNLNATNSTATDSEEIRAIVALEEELNDFQPIYRNPLLQKLYATGDEECDDVSDDSVYSFISIKHGAWWPSQQYLEEALDFSWSDFESQEQKEEIELIQNIDATDETDEDKKEKEALHKQIESDRQKRKEERQKQRKKDRQIRKNKKHQQQRRLLNNNRFDPLHALPNPANILMPQRTGDKGAGDVEADVLRTNMDQLKKRFSKGVMPGWHQRLQRGGGPPMAKGRFGGRHSLPFGNLQHLKHLDEMRNKNKEKLEKTPQDILKEIDLTKFGISNAVNDDTTDREKRADLERLEEAEVTRHPFMTLLTNPGEMEDVHCIKNEYRRHKVIFQVMDDAVVSSYNGKQSTFNYQSDVLIWYCYLVEIEVDAMSDLMAGGGAFKVNLSFSEVDMEAGFDYVDVYMNSMIMDSVSGIGRNWEQRNEAHPQFVYYLDREYIQRNGNALEVCMKIVTDSSVIRGGFTSTLTVDYDDPQISSWSEWSTCHTQATKAKNAKHWNGDCGIGVHEKSITQCANNSSVAVAPSNTCTVGEKRVEYCVKANCYDFPLKEDPKHPANAFKYNGHGRIDPDFADPFLVQRSTQTAFNLTAIIASLSAVRDEIVARYPNESVLGSAVINHYYMDQSKLRLGIRLARSLLLGDTFTVYTTGSSNTAGHENMFMSSWPLQFQSMMRPVWKRVGYKGAAFVVKNHAEGGHLSTVQLGPCIPSLIGDDADVVFWESQMNDHGDAVAHSVENHFRNVITLPRRPLYHVMHAGKNGPTNEKYEQEAATNTHKKGAFHNEQHCYGWLCGKHNGKNNMDFTGALLQSAYTDFGSGATQFYPSAALSAVNTTIYQEFETGFLYVSWHPSAAGHRVYAEMVAYHYLTCALETFADIADLIDDLTPRDSDTTNKPIEAMLEILEDPPRTKEIPHDHVANQCDPVCTNATEAVCISGYATLGKPRYSLKRWRQKDATEDSSGHWYYDSWMANAQPFSFKHGGQGSCDVKNKWETKAKDSNQLKFIFEAKQYGYVEIEGDTLADEKKVEIKINEIDMTATNGEHTVYATKPQYKQHGKAVKCEEGDNWLASDTANGCTVSGLKPYQKYEIVFNVLQNGTPVTVKNIRIF